MSFLSKFFDFITTPKEAEATPENIAKWEKRAPGSILHCNKCGMEEPFGKYGTRLKGTGKPRIFRKCPQCHKWSWLVIHKR